MFFCVFSCSLVAFVWAHDYFCAKKQTMLTQIFRTCLWCSFLLTFAFLFNGCNRFPTEEVPKEMHVIEELVLQNPDLALQLTEELEDCTRDYGELTRMRFELLKIRVRDKSIIPQTSDETAKKLVEYFEDNGTSNDRMSACYYLGGYYRDNAQPDSAIMWYKNAYALADTTAADFNYDIYSGIIHQIAGHFRYDYQEYLRWLHKINVNKEVGVYAHYKALAWGYRALHNDSLATHYYNLCREELEKDTINSIEKKHYINGMMGYFIGRRDTQNVMKLAPLFRQSYYETDERIPELIMGEYYAFINQNDSAIHYLREVVEKGTRAATIRGAYEDMFRLYLEEGNAKEAIRCAEESMRYRDSALTQESYERFLMANRFYDINLAEERLRCSEQHLKRGIYAILGISLLAGLGIIVLVFRQRRYRDRTLYEIKKQQQEVYSLQREYNNVKSGYDSLKERVETHDKLNREILSGKEQMVQKLETMANKGKIPDEALWNQLLECLCVDDSRDFDKIKDAFPRLSDINKHYLALVLVGIDGQSAATLLETSRQNVLRIRNKYKRKLQELGVKESTELRDMLNEYLKRAE